MSKMKTNKFKSNIWRKLQSSEDEHEGGYKLKSNSELIDIIAEFGNGETEFHTVDIERLIVENDLMKSVVQKLLNIQDEPKDFLTRLDSILGEH